MRKTKTTTKTTRSSWRIAVALVAACGGAPTATAQNFDFNASADIGIVYTDNLFLESTGGESELVYSIIPSLSLTAEGERLFGSIEYAPEAYFYADNNQFDDVADVLDASLTAAIVPESLFLFGSATNFQSIKSPEGSFPITNVVVTQNRVDSRVLEIRPYWQQRFGETQVSAAYRVIKVEFDDDLLQEQDARTIDFDINNFAAQQGLAWGLSYRDQEVEYESGFEFSYARASANVGYWIGRNLRLYVVGGLETPLGDFTDAGLEDDFYEAGFQWVPNSRLDLEIAAGKRTFGDSFRLRATYRLKRGSTALTYTQEPATRAELLFDRRPIQDLDNLDNFGDRPGEDDRFVQKRGQWTTTLELARTTIEFRVFDEDRSSRVDADGTQLGGERLSGVAFRTTWQLGRKMSVNAGVDYARRDFEPRIDEIYSLSAGATYSVSPRSNVRFVLARRDENNENTVAQDYVEYQARLFFSVSLK
ncbi:MAG: TIGR03016 family PEP-CTERM system-associated outer membrane protein [Pseudomonadota bacterium]